ncbi:short chain alcohol dehydrogenase-related dehydrogenase [Nitratireductor indicus C115]|uniref:Short chain alcohol dehydrogenase-related dehydrogenase n=1 Tax=Nitratireductor indicus C115 TaxID=1231190 RepID=K2P3A0_9HYPH|nr:SDR family oxidoreductase [Nitratireductor indicus]EKF41871.1 short chain alcohol dehydrogenase-related dehydrogenase [Nitratireductor indicus C115]SFQ66442.1 NAD(P)-dependent dehydrogenase, short-chain alcohol dehydrogenase family [Nitratireductor indicus]
MTQVAILGAGAGIGAALARRLAGPGQRLILHTGSRAASLDAVSRDCVEAGAETRTFLGDLAEEETMNGLRNAFEGSAPLDALVFAAGYARRSTYEGASEKDLLAALLAMPVAFHRAARCCLPYLAKGHGRIVCISAFGAHRTRQVRFPATAPAKAALEAQIRTLAAEAAPYGITCNAVVPGLIAKPKGAHSSLTEDEWAELRSAIPAGRFGDANEVAAVIAFLLSREAGYITGQSIHVDGGLTL